MGVQINFVVNKQLGLGPRQIKKVQADTHRLVELLLKIAHDSTWQHGLTTSSGTHPGTGDYLLLNNLDLLVARDRRQALDNAHLQDGGELRVIALGLLEGKDTSLRMRLKRAQKDMLRLQTEGHLNLMGMELDRCSVSVTGGAILMPCIMVKSTWRKDRIRVVFSDLYMAAVSGNAR